ncbi:MAG: hypothetical protein BWY78_00050 [Alphaproteobacteria bacterium ADurb.Bin438]|nr:MAG: hypothetical protein BWY78_00050 [Alphaproteobacteria bacterium ADurb.Bin438]
MNYKKIRLNKNQTIDELAKIVAKYIEVNKSNNKNILQDT